MDSSLINRHLGRGGPAWGTGRAARRASRLAPRYKLADRPAECSAPCEEEDGCSVGPSSLAEPAGEFEARRLSLERLYAAPLDWSRGLFPIVTIDGGAPPAGPAALAAGAPPQQQQDKRPPDTRERSPDYYANVGDAIRTLREDIPTMFDNELNFSIYREDIVFRDPRNSFQGLKNYKTIFWSLRFHGRIFFTRLYVDVKRIWQTEDGCIRMRWTVHGVPRVPWEAEGIFDGISQYKLDHEGRIYEHAVDNVILRDPPVGVLPWLYSINLSPASQQAVPGAFFAPGGGGGGGGGGGACAAAEAVEEGQQQRRAAALAAAAAAEQQQQSGAEGGGGTSQPAWWSSLLARFSWVRFYAAMIATMQLLQQQGIRLQLQPAAVQRVCAERS
ncbi:MAG: hypothetical protein J3K34DRAFT_389018 [Monoraphidium minutum]|nr:MAG: hypothetical protein J3K34DRAFT_389018 [Monoraphidium minutum]